MSNPAEVYEYYIGPALVVPWTQVLLEHAAPQPSERVLDVGCGTGIVARYVAPLVGATGSVVGLDISPAMLAVARTRPIPSGALIEWHEGNAASLPFPDKDFDLVLCQHSLPYFHDRSTALQEMRRVLAPGGRVVVAVWQSLERQPFSRPVNEAIARHLDLPVSAIAIQFSLGDAEELRTMLNLAGFHRVDITPHERIVRFPSPGRFVELAVLGSAAVKATFAEMDASARSALVQAVSHDLETTLRQFTDGDSLAYPVAAHIAVARVAQ
jgi:ubiquinone/menaquinone biosynthesis C-methylase UbiE